MRMLVLGAGLQGSACAYDLLQNRSQPGSARRSSIRPPARVPQAASGPRLIPTTLDVRDREAVLAVMRECDAVMSAIPYYFNLAARRVRGRGRRALLRSRRQHRDRVPAEGARRPRGAKGVTVVPDCGVAPGMVNILAEYGIRQLDTVDSVRIYVGGLPQNPEPPLNYQIVYSLEGVLDYYTTLLVGAARRAAHAGRRRSPSASRWNSRSPWARSRRFTPRAVSPRWRSATRARSPTMEYKTLRYPGHAEIMEAIRELGLLDLEPVDVKGVKVVAARRVRRLVGPQAHEAEREGPARAAGDRRRHEGWQAGDASLRPRRPLRRAHGISAMMRTTGYSLSITGQMQVRREVGPAGVWTPDECMPPQAYIAELRARGIDIEETSR